VCAGRLLLLARTVQHLSHNLKQAILVQPIIQGVSTTTLRANDLERTDLNCISIRCRLAWRRRLAHYPLGRACQPAYRLAMTSASIFISSSAADARSARCSGTGAFSSNCMSVACATRALATCWVTMRRQYATPAARKPTSAAASVPAHEAASAQVNRRADGGAPAPRVTARKRNQRPSRQTGEASYPRMPWD